MARSRLAGGPGPARPGEETDPEPAAGQGAVRGNDAAARPDGLPSRDELTLAWGDAILPGLPGRVRAYVQLGRFLASGPDAAIYALPDAGLLSRAETTRADFERALASHFGRPVPVRLVLDDKPSPLADPTGGPSAPVAGEEDPRNYVLAEMEDATAVVSPEQRLLQAFPGAEEVTP